MKEGKLSDDEDLKLPASTSRDQNAHSDHILEDDMDDHVGLTPSNIPDHISSHDGDDDDDNWSRQVETDETTTGALGHEDSFRMESVLEQHHDRAGSAGENMRLNMLSIGSSNSGGGRIDVPRPPIKPELTLKEKLVLRERQRRVETQRARLKRQFALSGTSNANDEDDNANRSDSSETGRRCGGAGSLNHSDDIDGEGDILRGDGSIAEGTLGEESTKAHPDEEGPAHDEAARLGFNMERFLRNSDSFNPQLEPMDENQEGGGANSPPDQGVVMERFLNDPVVVPSVIENDPQMKEDSGRARDDIVGDMGNQGPGSVGSGRVVDAPRSVSFDIAAPPVDPMPSFGYDMGANASLVSNASVQAEAGEIDSVNADDDMVVNNMPPSFDGQEVNSNASDGIASEEPRVLRLTEADMQEMAAIDEVSIGNAPPSEREEEMLSEIGELADFGGGHHIIGDITAVSQDTPTTAMESASQISDGIGNQSNRSAQLAHRQARSASSLNDPIDNTSSEHRSVDGLPIASMSSQILLSPGAVSNHSVTANPPSVIEREEVDNADMMIDGGVVVTTDDNIDNRSNNRNIDMLRGSAELLGDDDDMIRRNENDEGLVNRRLRPGFGTSPQIRGSPERGISPGSPAMLSGNYRSAPPGIVDDFDYNKESDFQSPYSGVEHDPNESLSNLPPDNHWPSHGNMNYSPLRNLALGSASDNGDQLRGSNNIHERYGSMENDSVPRKIQTAHINSDGGGRFSDGDENTPLLGGDIPPEIITRQHRKGRSQSLGDVHEDKHSPHMPSLFTWDRTNRKMSFQRQAVTDCVFHEVKSHNEVDDVEVHHDSEVYLKSNAFLRAFPERQFALIVTLILEIPVLLVITGGSDALCQLIGRKRYHLLIGFVPLTSAISGNVGLQASTLTTRAISHAHVTQESYIKWFLLEVWASVYLGLGMGLILGSIAYVASSYDLAFGATIAIAQWISIVTAGITGTFAPLLFSFIFQRDSGKWGGPLETAIQDIVGSFAMMVVSYHILMALGNREIDPDDLCFVGGTDDDFDDVIT